MSAGPLSATLAAALTAADLDDDDERGALVELARMYARLLDDAEAVSAAVADFPTPENGNDRQALDALRRRVGASETAAVLGPKYLAALQSLGLADSTAAGAARSSRSGPLSADQQHAFNALAQMRAKRAAEHRARAGGVH